MLCMIFAGLGFVTMVLYLAMNGSGGRVASVIAYLALKALVAGGSVAPVAVYADPEMGKAPRPGLGYASGVIHQFLF